MAEGPRRALGFVSTTEDLAAAGFYERRGFQRCTSRLHALVERDREVLDRLAE